MRYAAGMQSAWLPLLGSILAQSRPRPQIGLTAMLIGVGLCVVVFGFLAFVFRNKE